MVATFKGVGGRYNSFQRNPEMVGIVDRSLVKSTELYTEDDIMAFPFQTEVSLQDWHYQKGGSYRSAEEIITRLMQNVSRNGCLLLNITQHGRGNIDGVITMSSILVRAVISMPSSCIPHPIPSSCLHSPVNLLL